MQLGHTNRSGQFGVVISYCFDFFLPSIYFLNSKQLKRFNTSAVSYTNGWVRIKFAPSGGKLAQLFNALPPSLGTLGVNYFWRDFSLLYFYEGTSYTYERHTVCQTFNLFKKRAKRKMRCKLNKIFQNFKIFPNVTKSYEEAIGNFKLT